MTAQSDLIVYIGGATVRSISVQEFKDGAGITAPNDLVWNWQNKKRVPFSQMNQEVLDHLMEQHPGEFKLVKAKEVPADDDTAPVAPVGGGVAPPRG